MTTPQPPMIPTRIWRGRLEPPTQPPRRADVRALVVHYTATTDDYAELQAVHKVRAIYQYHAFDKAWGMMGYQYLIDRYGIIYVGREDGEDGKGGGNVQAAHVGGYNTGTCGIGLIGTFGDGAPQVALDALLSLSTWLCDKWQLDPYGGVVINGHTVDTIAGHKDFPGKTACPGQLYHHLAWLRFDVQSSLEAAATAPMTLNEYQALALRTVNNDLTHEQMLGSCALGLTGEAGEVAEIVKKRIYHGHPLDKDALAGELGDVLWYLSVMANEIGLTLENIAAGNIAKLTARYPEGFTEEASRERTE